jgi:hypothetical protein
MLAGSSALGHLCARLEALYFLCNASVGDAQTWRMLSGRFGSPWKRLMYTWSLGRLTNLGDGSDSFCG